MDDLFTEVVVKKNRTMAESVLKTLPVYLTILILALGIFIQPFLLALLLIPLLMKVFLSPRLDVEYEYSYVSGELDIAKIFSRQSRKQIASYNMKEMELLAPLSSSHMDGFRGNPNIKKADYSSGKPENSDLRENMGAAAHLIHGSADGRFRITYAVKNISQEEIRGVGFIPASYDEMAQRYNPFTLHYGYNTLPDGEEIYFIPNPALGLWINREKF